MKKLLSVLALVAAISSCEKNKTEKHVYKVNESVSRAEWKGSAPHHFHLGGFKVTGSLTTNKNGVINGGEFTIPIASIENYDLPDTVKPQLLNHLLSADFFDVALHPNAKFKINSVTSYAQPDTGVVKNPNYLLTGEFTMIGKTQRITFPCRITAAGDSIISEAAFKIDKSKWGMNKYDDPTKELYILPDVNIHLKMRAGIQ